MNNIADICRECELSGKTRELERRLSEMAIEVVALTEENRAIKQAGTRLSNRIIDVLDNIIDESALEDAVSKWEKAKGGIGVMEELKRCPFCGGETEMRYGIWTDDGYIECVECKARSVVCFPAEDAIAAWNRRLRDEK